MIKLVLYILLFITTAVRLAGIIYLLAGESTNLPTLILAVTSATVLYGLALIIKRLVGSIRLKQLMLFFIIQTVAFSFNMAYFAITSPLKISFMETLAVGTFLDILLNCCAVYLCIRQMRGRVLKVD